MTMRPDWSVLHLIESVGMSQINFCVDFESESIAEIFTGNTPVNIPAKYLEFKFNVFPTAPGKYENPLP
jgi:hypothetical protein